MENALLLAGAIAGICAGLLVCHALVCAGEALHRLHSNRRAPR